MPNIKSAIKRQKQSLSSRVSNRQHKSTMRTEIKNFLKSLEEGNKEAAETALNDTLSRIDKTGKRNIIHIKSASRLKSRLTRRFNRAFS